MNSTLKLLSTIIVEEDRKLSIDEIAIAYRDSLNPSLFALAFEKMYKLIISVSHNYYGLTEDDVISYGMEKLDYCLQTFKVGQAEFSTYFTMVLMNKFREETQALNTHKRKAMFFSDSYEAMLENGFDLIDCTIEEDNFIESLHEYNLTAKELQYCDLILSDWSNSEISKMMGVSIMTLSNMRKKLREKLMPLALGF